MNGKLVASDTDADLFINAPTSMAWGGLVRQTQQYNPGEFSGTNIYDRALSASEIQELYINPDLPMQQYPAWWGKAPAAPSGIVPIIQAHTRRRRAG